MPWHHTAPKQYPRTTTNTTTIPIPSTQGSQVWAGSVEIELHYIPEGESGDVQVDSTRGGRLFGGADGNSSSGSGSGRDNSGISGSRHGCGSGGCNYPPISPCSTSLASSFVKAAKSLPEKARASGAAAAASATVVQADLLALSPRTARGAEAVAAGRRYAGRGGTGGGDGTEKKGARGRGAGGEISGGGGSWKSFFWGGFCTLLLVFGALWALGDPVLMSAQFGFGLTVLEDGGAGRQAVVLIHGSVSKEWAILQWLEVTLHVSHSRVGDFHCRVEKDGGQGLFMSHGLQNNQRQHKVRSS